MARKRMIDPNIWCSEDFATLTFTERLLFIGMFSLADDEGRGIASPKYLKAQIFRYDDISIEQIDEGIGHIEQTMSVKVYQAEGKWYYQLLHWKEWQTISRPTPSRIPAIQNNSLNTHGVLNESSLNTHGVLNEDSIPKEKNRKEENRKETNISLFSASTETEKREREEERENEEKKSTKRKEEKEREEVKEKKDSCHLSNDDVVVVFDGDSDKRIPSSLDKVIDYARSLGITTRTTSEAFFDFFSSNGWKVSGKAPMKDWKAAFRNWVRNEKKYSRQTRNYDEHEPTNLDHILVDLDAEI